jgi:3',5'-cyclic-AMP phosphodiesterase
MVHDGSEEQMKFFHELVSPSRVPVKYITGEHDWYLDMGESYSKHFGKTTYSWDAHGVHFIALDTVQLRDFWTVRGLSAQERMDIAAGSLSSGWPQVSGAFKNALDWLQLLGDRDPSAWREGCTACRR